MWAAGRRKTFWPMIQADRKSLPQPSMPLEVWLARINSAAVEGNRRIINCQDKGMGVNTKTEYGAAQEVVKFVTKIITLAVEQADTFVPCRSFKKEFLYREFP